MKVLTYPLAILWLLVNQPLSAEIVVDASLGGTAQKITGPNYNIHEGLGQRRGTNVFHSFSQFDIQAGENAQFSVQAPTDNILARVTGGNSSLVDGTISTLNTSANLWLINPAGWLIGPNAQLNIQGAFHLTSADGIGFGNHEIFFADPTGESVLSLAAPIDYQFNADHQATITLDRASLIMPDNQDISLVGGDITLTNSSISSSGGNLILISNSGEGIWQQDGTGLTQLSGTGGTITIEHSTPPGVDSVQPFSLSSSKSESNISAGLTQINAKQINLKNAVIRSQAWENQPAQNTLLDAEHIKLDATLITSEVFGSQNAGTIQISANDLSLTGGSIIKSNTSFFTTGKGGNINLDIAHLLDMSDRSAMTSQALGNDGGNINIQARQIILNDMAEIRVDTQAENNAGNIVITAQKLVMNTDTTLDSSTISFDEGVGGQGGNITIIADDVALTRTGLITSESFSAGDAGHITIQTDDLSLNNGSEIRARSQKTGATGTITLTLNHILKLQNNSSINTSSRQTNGGQIVIDSKTLALDHSNIITSVKGESGDGGDIAVNTNTLLMNGGFIQANTAAVGARGGDIQINAEQTIASRESVSVGGEIRQQFEVNTVNNVIQAAAPDGVSGQVNLNTVELNIAGQLAKVDSDFFHRKAIADDPCHVDRHQKMSSLIRQGQGGLPRIPSDQINVPLHHLLPDAKSPDISQRQSSKPQQVLLATQTTCQREWKQ